jgi:membrane associated rhomboid family serine protease
MARVARKKRRMRTKRTQLQELPWLLAKGGMTWAAGAAILMIILYIFQWSLSYFDPGGPERWFGLNRAGMVYGCIWEFLTYPFVHHFSHPFGFCFAILGLMLVGVEIEGIIGRNHFVTLFLGSGFVAGLIHLAISPTALLLGGQPAVCALIMGCSTILSEFLMTLPFRIRFRYKYLGWSLILGLLGYGLFSGRADACSTALLNLSGAAVGWIYVRILGFGSPLPGEMALRRRLAERARLRRLPLRLYLATYVDPILEKIHQDGFQSLSRAEKQVLQQARQKVMLKVS